jgi:hypothetical protein
MAGDGMIGNIVVVLVQLCTGDHLTFKEMFQASTKPRRNYDQVWAFIYAHGGLA